MMQDQLIIVLCEFKLNTWIVLVIFDIQYLYFI